MIFMHSNPSSYSLVCFFHKTLTETIKFHTEATFFINLDYNRRLWDLTLTLGTDAYSLGPHEK